jgi:hypothetical protein
MPTAAVVKVGEDDENFRQQIASNKASGDTMHQDQKTKLLLSLPIQLCFRHQRVCS